uniref:MANSC domain-containing protein 4-like n=1 Tax=Doryrhamphus excisus TaxID=161450 RepID=UPI0025AE56A6|nr:MANSC domain-containing protein 4-like [Doryrhamphus excisus]
MKVSWGLLALFLGVLVCRMESRCSPTSYYKNCWIRHFPGILIDTEESGKRGASLVRSYQEESALRCSRSCCLTTNASCNVAIFDYDATRDNCLHLHCPTLESCIITHRDKVVLYNITKGTDPDLLVFGKHLNFNVRVLPHHFSRVNASEVQPPSDKRQFFPLPAPITVKPATATVDAAAKGPPTATTSPSSSSTFRTTSMASPGVTITPSSRTATPPPTSLGAASENHTFSTSTFQPQTSAREHGSPTAGGEDAIAGLAAGRRSLLVALLSCVAVLLLGCCCCVQLLVSWRRGGMRGYRVPQRSGSMRLIKYRVVRESS